MSGDKEVGDTITLDDIETMLAILERFIQMSKRAERVFRRVSPMRSGGQGDMMQMLMSSMIQQKMSATPQIGDQTSDDVTDEEITELLTKLKAKKRASP